MYNNDVLETIPNVVERSTIYNVFEACAIHFKYIMSEKNLNQLEELNNAKKLTWTILSDTLREALYGTNPLDEEKTLQTIFDNRKEYEEIALSIIDGKCLDLYYLLENRPLKIIYHKIRQYFDVSVEKIITKRNLFKKSSEIIHKIIELKNNGKIQFDILDDSTQNALFSKMSTLEEIFNYSSILVPKIENKKDDKKQLYDNSNIYLYFDDSIYDNIFEELLDENTNNSNNVIKKDSNQNTSYSYNKNDYNIINISHINHNISTNSQIKIKEQKFNLDLLQDTLRALHIIYEKKPKNKKPTKPITRVTTCAFCWRPALVRTARKKHSAYCKNHSYEKRNGKPAHKQAYNRTRKVRRELDKYPEFEARISTEMQRLFPYTPDLLLMRIGRWNWWENEPPTVARSLPIEEETISHVLDLIPHVRRYLENQNCDLHDINQIIKTLMPLPEGANEEDETDYHKWLNVWNTDFRRFLPVLARAQVWLGTFAKLYPNQEPDNL